jgi:hypothetical protein
MSGTSLASSARQDRYTGGVQAGSEGVLTCRADRTLSLQAFSTLTSCSWSHVMLRSQSSTCMAVCKRRG